MLNINSKMSNNITIITVEGRIVYETEKEFKKYIADIISNGEIKIVLDMEKLSYINSAGLGLLINLHKNAKAQGGGISLSNLNADINELFHITNLNQIFSIFGSTKDALSSF